MTNKTINSVISQIDSFDIADVFTCLPEDCPKIINTSIYSFKVIHLNIRSINKNFDDLIVMLTVTNMDYDVIVLSECWLSKVAHPPELSGYLSYKSDNNRNQNDGVVVYIKKQLHSVVSFPNFSEANCVLLEIDGLIIVAIYRSPSAKCLDNFFSDLNCLLSTLRLSRNLLLIGDMNIDISSSNNDINKDKYLNLTASHGLLPTYITPTRIKTCLDHAFLKCNNRAAVLLLDCPLTDHTPVTACLNLDMARSKSDGSSLRTNFTAAVEEIMKTDFSSVTLCDNADLAANTLINSIAPILSKNTIIFNIPKKKIILKPWITPGLLRCIRHRDRLHKRYKINTDNEINKLIYTRYRNFCNGLLRRIKREFESFELKKARHNPKATWDTLKRIANLTVSSTSATNLLKSNIDPKLAVNDVNRFFANIGKHLADKILAANLAGTASVQSSPCNSMGMTKVDEYEVSSIINGLRGNCAVGWDGVSSKIIKSCAQVLVPPITWICNLAITTGIFPKVFKTALVHPIHKSGPTDNVNNYRPISILSALSKVLERIMNKQLSSYLEKFNIISNNQFGFTSGLSTEDAVLSLTNHIAQSLDNKTKCIGIFLDLSKAFDTVSIPILLRKLEAVGVRGITLKLFASYLSRRTQIVKIGEHSSEELSLTYGVPQGSILGPTLFKIYINELCQLPLPHCKIVSYADDTALVVTGSDWSVTKLHAEHAVRTVMDWLNMNLLTVNVEKTKYIPFSLSSASEPPQDFTVAAHSCDLTGPTCQCMNLCRTDCIKYLGILIDENMNWRSHIENICSRVRKVIFVMKKLRYTADRNTLIMVYEALCKCVISYCIPVWGGAHKTSLIKLERAQRAVLKVMLCKPFRYPTVQLYQDCGVLSVRQLFVLHTILRRHPSVLRNDLKNSSRRRKPVCPVLRYNTVFASRQYRYISSYLYNRISTQVQIVHLSKYRAKKVLHSWLLARDYELTESLVHRGD